MNAPYFLQKNNYIETISIDSLQYYGERVKGKNRNWNPYKSKLGAGIVKGLKQLSLTESSKILYLGSATGTTISHLSDILRQGSIYAVDISRDMMIKCMKLVYLRDNITPFLLDASKTNFTEQFDMLFQDISCKEQVGILIHNSAFVKREGSILLSLKTQSIDSSRPPKEIMKEQKILLEKEFSVIELINLEPYEKHHWLFHLKKRL